MELGALVIQGVSDSVHVSVSVGPDALHGDGHRIVEEAVDATLLGVLVFGDVIDSAVEHLTNSITSSTLLESFPEPLGHLRDGVDSETVDVILGDHPVNPVIEFVLNGLALSVEVGQVSETAVFDSPLIIQEVILVDVAVLVVISLILEDVEFTVVSADGTHVVGDNIHHYPHVTLVHLCDEVAEVLFRPEFLIKRVQISGPVSMVATRSVLDDG